MPAAASLAAAIAFAWWFFTRPATSREFDAPQPPVAPAREEPALPEVAPDTTATRAPIRSEPVDVHDANDLEPIEGELRRSGMFFDEKSSGFELSIVDATTRAPLPDVIVETGGETSEEFRNLAPPGAGVRAPDLDLDLDGHRAPFVRGASPLRIELPGHFRRSRTHCLIGAPGHATVSRWFDAAFSGWRRHEVALPVAAELEVVVHGRGLERSGAVELYDAARLTRRLAGRASGLEELLGDPASTAHLLRDLSPDYHFSMDLSAASDPFVKRIGCVPCGDWFGLARFGSGEDSVFGCAHAMTTASVGVARLEFELQGLAPRRLGDFGGTVRFASGWSDDEILSARWVRFTLLDTWPEPQRPDLAISAVLERTDDRHVLRFDAGWNRAGRFAGSITEIPAVLLVERPGIATDQEVAGAGGRARDLELFLDEPATPIVHVRDRRDGSPLERVELRFDAGPADLRHDFSGGRIVTNAEGTARLPRVPRGPFHVEVHPPAPLAFTVRDLELVTGENLIDFAVGLQNGLALTLRDGRDTVPWMEGIDLAIAPAAAPKARLELARRIRFVGLGCEVDLDEPGRYVVTVRDVVGFDDPAPIEIEVKPGKRATADVALGRPR